MQIEQKWGFIMNLKKKIVCISVVPVLLLCTIILILTATIIKSSMVDEIQDALKGTASATIQILSLRYN